MLAMDYPERAALVLSKYFDEYDKDELLSALKAAYAQFDDGDAAPLVKVENGMFMLELYHGPTCAFKDMALTVLPYLLRKGCDLLGIKETILILVATSGDTGKAALEGFRDREGVKIMVVYPDDGVSKMQKLQMCTQDGENVNVVAVKGNFDDCQTTVKRIFHSEECKEELAKRNIRLSSANSINFGRLAPQIAYYFSAYLDLVSSEQIKMGGQGRFHRAHGQLRQHPRGVLCQADGASRRQARVRFQPQQRPHRLHPARRVRQQAPLLQDDVPLDGHPHLVQSRTPSL